MRCLLLLLFAGPVVAIAQNSVEVSYHGNREYTFALTFIVPAPPEQVFALLTDYENLDRLNSSIQHSEIVEQSSEFTRVKLLANVCVLFMCKTVTSVEDVHILEPQTRLRSEAVPALSQDIEAGHTNWRLEPNPAGTRVSVDSLVRFSFWSPPLIGPYAIKNELRKNVGETIRNLRQLAVNSSAVTQ